MNTKSDEKNHCSFTGEHHVESHKPRTNPSRREEKKKKRRRRKEEEKREDPGIPAARSRYIKVT